MPPLESNGALVALDLPEHGQLELPLAGLGGRSVAALIDFGLMFVLGALISIGAGFAVSGGFSDLILPMVFAILVLLPLVGPLFFELSWRGQTPGKRRFQLRVISADGSPASRGQILLRNVMRLVDFLPLGYSFGVVSMFVSARSQRLGDLVAGTLVIREDPKALEQLSGWDAPINAPAALHGIPEPLLRGAQLLLDPDRQLDPRIREQRRAQLAAQLKKHRPDWAGDDDGAVLERIRSALDDPT